MRFSCVIFDVDGTLTRTNDLIFASFNHVAQKYLGRTFPERDIIALFGPPEEGALAQVFPPDVVDRAMEDLCAFYELHHSSMASLHAGIDEALAMLRSKGVRTAVFTGKGRRTAEITLRKLGIDRHFDLIVSGNDVAMHKPAPEGIHRVLSEFTVEPRETLMVGDALGDIRASRGAGVSVAAVLWDSYDRERVCAAQPDFQFSTVREFVGWLAQHT